MAIMLISAPATLEGKSDSLRVIFVAFLLGNCNAQTSPEHTKVHIKCLCSNRNHKSKLTHFKNKTVAATNTTNHHLTLSPGEIFILLAFVFSLIVGEMLTLLVLMAPSERLLHVYPALSLVMII